MGSDQGQLILTDDFDRQSVNFENPANLIGMLLSSFKKVKDINSIENFGCCGFKKGRNENL